MSTENIYIYTSTYIIHKIRILLYRFKKREFALNEKVKTYLVDRYDKTVSKMKEDLLSWCTFLILDLTTWRVFCGNQRLLTLLEHLSLPRFFGGVHVVHLFLVLNVVSVLFLSCPCCSPKFVSNCWFPFALNIPLVFLYFSFKTICHWNELTNYFQMCISKN